MAPLQFGLDTFGDVTVDGAGQLLNQATVLRHVVAEAELAEQVGVDVFGVGEHHRDDFAVSAPEVVMAAIVARTERLRISSAVTVLSSDDPVRVYERFATLDALSNGRAEVILGRGSFTESFPLFGYNLEQYHELFEEKLELFVALLRDQPVTWRGRTRAGLTDQAVYPALERGPFRVWIGVGGSPASVVRAAHHRLGLTLAIIGGDPRRFVPYAELYRTTLARAGAGPLPIAAHSPGHVGESDSRARDEFWPHYRAMHARIGAERGWGPLTRADFDREIEQGALCVGSPDTVAAKITTAIEALGLDRFDLKYSAGTLPHETMMQSIARYGREVIPRVREMLGQSTSSTVG